jgi:hypothetical protein
MVCVVKNKLEYGINIIKNKANVLQFLLLSSRLFTDKSECFRTNGIATLQGNVRRTLEAANLSNFIENILILLSHLITQIRTLLTVIYQIRRRKQIQLDGYFLSPNTSNGATTKSQFNSNM